MLTHEAYLDALQASRSTTAEWRAVVAGFLVLRLIDAWLDDDGFLVTSDTAAVYAVREALAGVSERDPVLPMLCELVEVVTQSAQASVSSIASLMLAYGRMLHVTNRWRLALDVFASLLSHAQAVQEELTTVRAAARLAFVLKHLGQFDVADDVYALALQVSLRIRRFDLYYKTYCGFADSLASRGRLKEAEHILNTVVVEATALGSTDIHADALHDLSFLAVLREDYSSAIQIGQTALMHISRPAARDRALVNCGAAFVGYGDHYAAKQLLLPVLQRTQEEELRQRALINLLEIAAKDADKPDFDRYRQELDGTSMLPDVQAYYRLYVAKGHYIFKNAAAATEEWRTAFEIASAHGLTQVCRLIKSDIATLDRRSNRDTQFTAS